MDDESLRPRQGDALLVVDVQNDFLPGGALAVPDGNAVVPVLNRYLELFHGAGLPIYASRDWHPPGHCSFREQGGPWPPHCLAGSVGADFPAHLELPAETQVISKATQPDADAYSGFAGTGLEAALRAEGVTRLLVGGLATDYCVLNTVRDALSHGFAVLLLEDAIRAVEVAPGDGDRAMAEMTALGVRAIRYADLPP